MGEPVEEIKNTFLSLNILGGLKLTSFNSSVCCWFQPLKLNIAEDLSPHTIAIIDLDFENIILKTLH